MLGGSTLFCYTALLIFITVSVMCGVIKYFHVCPPYESEISYYYPVRRLIVAIYLSPLTLVPCLTCPYSMDGWLYGRAFMLLGFGVPLIIATERHYGRNTNMRLAKVEVGVLFTLEMIGFVLSILDMDILANHLTFYYIMVGILLVYMHARVYNGMGWLHKKIKEGLRDTYSSEEDFRSPFTHAVLWMLAPFFLATTIAFVWNSKLVMAIVLLLVGVRFTLYLLITLSSVKAPRFTVVYDNDEELMVVPRADVHNAEMYVDEPASTFGKTDGQKTVIDNDMSTVAVPPVSASSSEVEKAKIESEINCELARQKRVQSVNLRHAERIAQLMEEQQLFLRAHLTVEDLAKALGVNSTYVREACKVNYDNFFDMVNSYRIEYAKTFSEENPNYSREAIALACGFGSYRSYLRAEEKYANRQMANKEAS